MPGGRIDYSGAYTDFVLMHSTSRSRLYRAVRGGKYFMLKTAATADGMQEASLRREYELSLGMQHQHVATVLTYEPSLPVGPAIVMEYVDGTDLRRFLSTNPDAATRRRIFSQLLDAVAYIHRSGIIHNDLKPENILITRINNDVKIIDFGYSADAAHYLTRTLGGTRRYASPELLERADDIDSRSDVYSLGVNGRPFRQQLSADSASVYVGRAQSALPECGISSDGVESSQLASSSRIGGCSRGSRFGRVCVDARSDERHATSRRRSVGACREPCVATRFGGRGRADSHRATSGDCRQRCRAVPEQCRCRV